MEETGKSRLAEQVLAWRDSNAHLLVAFSGMVGIKIWMCCLGTRTMQHHKCVSKVILEPTKSIAARKELNMQKNIWIVRFSFISQ